MGALVNIGLLYTTIQIWDLYAVPIALTLGYVANVLMRIFTIRKTVKIKFNFKRLVLDLAVITIACVVIYCNLFIVWKVFYGLILCGGVCYIYRNKLINGAKSIKKKLH